MKRKHRLNAVALISAFCALILLPSEGLRAHSDSMHASEPVHSQQTEEIASSPEEAHEHGMDHHDAASAEPPAGHRHGTEEADHDKTFGQRLISWLGSFHVAVVHLPIGLLLGAFLAEILLMATDNPAFASASRFCAWTGALAAIAAMGLGWLYAGFSLKDTEAFLSTHRWIGTAAGIWVVLLLASSLRLGDDAAGRSVYRLLLFVGVLLVSVNGYVGGLLVHGAHHHAF